MKRTLVCLLLFTAAAACTPKETAVRLKVEVKTNQGDAVNAAVVSIDGKALGQTDNSGAFTGEVKLPIGAKKKVEVRKESDTYYFAPYFQSFAVGESGPQDLGVNATLYFVPKPLPAGAVARAARRSRPSRHRLLGQQGQKTPQLGTPRRSTRPPPKTTSSPA